MRVWEWQAKIIRLKSGKSRGFGYVQFESEDDLKEAYKRADGRKIDGHRCVETCFTVSLRLLH